MFEGMCWEVVFCVCDVEEVSGWGEVDEVCEDVCCCANIWKNNDERYRSDEIRAEGERTHFEACFVCLCC